MKSVPKIENCPLHKVMDLFQGKWSMWVLFELSKNETMRFGELKKAIPNISNTMLTATLKELEKRKLIERIQYNEIPPHVEYAATEMAKELRTAAQEITEWGNKYL